MLARAAGGGMLYPDHMIHQACVPARIPSAPRPARARAGGIVPLAPPGGAGAGERGVEPVCRECVWLRSPVPAIPVFPSRVRRLPSAPCPVPAYRGSASKIPFAMASNGFQCILMHCRPRAKNRGDPEIFILGHFRSLWVIAGHLQSSVGAVSVKLWPQLNGASLSLRRPPVLHLPAGEGRGEGKTSHLEIGCRMNETALAPKNDEQPFNDNMIHTTGTCGEGLVFIT